MCVCVREREREFERDAVASLCCFAPCCLPHGTMRNPHVTRSERGTRREMTQPRHEPRHAQFEAVSLSHTHTYTQDRPHSAQRPPSDGGRSRRPSRLLVLSPRRPLALCSANHMHACYVAFYLGCPCLSPVALVPLVPLTLLVLTS